MQNMKNRKDLLIRKNRQRLYCAELNKVLKNVKEDDFLDIDKTKKISNMIIEKMNTMDKEGESITYNISAYCKKLVCEGKKIIRVHSKIPLVFFQYNSGQLGAISFAENTISSYLEFLYQQSGLAQGKSDFILTDYNLNFGYCIWKSEYEIKLYSWTN